MTPNIAPDRAGDNGKQLVKVGEGTFIYQLIRSNRAGWLGRVLGARWMQGGTGLPG